jgi:hypothetical protein
MMRVLLVSMLSLLAAACGTHVVRPAASLPAELQVKASKLPRVWVAGFATGKDPEFDLSLETVRLLRTQLRTWSSAQVIDAEPLSLDEQRMTDVPYWRRQGEEHGSPLIVTGTVRLLLAPPRIEQRGPRTFYVIRAGRILEATVVMIDGRSGEVLSARKLPSRMRYGIGRFASGLGLFFQMMDQAMPEWFDAIAEASVTSREPNRS